jgi:hypothetical protein
MARPQFLAPGEDGPQPVFLLVPAVNFFGELGPRVCHQIGTRPQISSLKRLQDFGSNLGAPTR